MKLKYIFSLLIFIVCTYTSYTQSFMNKKINWDGNEREYAVYIPDSYDGNSDYPLLFNFHGGGDYISNWIYAVDMRSIADTANFIVVYPQALPDPTDGGSTNWMRKQPTTFDDVPFVGALIDSLSSEYNIDQERIYACGYSLGGEFTYEVACKLNHRIAAIGVVARTKYIETFNNCSPIHSTGVMSILGTNDFISDYNGIIFGGIQYYLSADETHDYWINYNDCLSTPEVTNVPNSNTSDGSTVERYSWSDSDGCKYVEHLKVIGGGHDWPGDFGNMDINSSQEIWNFVSRYDINGLMECATTSTSENDFSQSTYSVYPNPFDNQLIVNSNIKRRKKYEIYTLFGEMKISGYLDFSENKINVTTLPPNLYYLKIDDQTTKLLKAK